VVASLDAERAALTQTERERFVAQALSRLSAEATAEQRREVEQLAGALFDEQQALQARQRLMEEGRSVIDRTRTATEQYAAEIAKLNELLQAGAIDQATYARAVEDANDRALRSSQAWTNGATRFLKDYAAESNDAAAATEQAFATAFSCAEDSLVGFISTGELEFQSLADSILADLARMTVRQTLTAPLAGALQSAFASGGLFGLFHEGGRSWRPGAGTRSATSTGPRRGAAGMSVKHYPSGSVIEVRTITKPVAGTVKVYLDSVEQLSGWSVDTTTGLVTFGTAPALGVEVTADFEFDVPVRFDTDHMAVTIETYRLHAWQQIPIVELRT
jgi:lambda family phage tail tape measure protein